MNLSLISFFMLLILAPVQSAQATDYRGDGLSAHSIHFIILPYLHAYRQIEQQPSVVIQSRQYQQHLSTDQWRITTTSIPEYHNRSSKLQMIDSNRTRESRLTFRQNLIIPLSIPLKPVKIHGLARKPLWIQMFKTGSPKQAWHAPALTPVAAAMALAEQKRKAALAKRMADRAFYFGYDTNKDALK